jgi:hypothetical protein
VVKSKRVNFLFRRFRENRATTVAIAVVLVLAAIIAWNLFSPHADPGLDAIRQKGYPITLSELNAWYRPVPDSQNNARIYEQVFALPGFSETESVEINLPSRGQVLSAQDKKQLLELVTTNEVALRLLHSASASNRCRYSVDLTKGFQLKLPHLSKVFRGVKLLSAEALLHSANGESQQTVRSFLAAGRLADSLSEEPLLISQLVRFASWGIIVSRMERAIHLTQMTDEQLAALQVIVGEAERPEAFLRAQAGERAMGIAVFTAPATQIVPLQALYSQLDGWKNRLLISFLKTTGLFQKDRAFYLGVMSTNVAAALLTFPDRVKLGQQSPNVVPRFCIISAMILPAISRNFAREADTIARLRAAQTALAIERFRREHGQTLPVSLEELVPVYCKSAPTDPYDGHPLRFKTLDSGYVIYSIGNDGRDDGGLERNPKNLQAPHDITFRVER